MVISAFVDGERQGTYWGIRSHVADYGPPAGSLACPPESTRKLAETKTRLKRMDGWVQERLINWGYAICDAGMRTWVDPTASPPGAFPYPSSGIG
jgi:NTE family protein